MHWAELTVSLTKTLLPTASVLGPMPPNLTFLYDSRQIFFVHFCINFNTLYRNFTQFKKNIMFGCNLSRPALRPKVSLLPLDWVACTLAQVIA